MCIFQYILRYVTSSKEMMLDSCGYQTNKEEGSKIKVFTEIQYPP